MRWLFALSAVSILGQTESPEPYTVSEAYEVYSAVLPDESRAERATTLVIRDEVVSYEMCLYPDEESKKIIGPAIAHYQIVNRKRWRLQRDFHLQRTYELMPADKLAYVFSDPEAGRWIELSAVGFNDAKTVAVVHIGHRACGGRCAGGSFTVLEKKNGKWQPLRWKGSACAWGS